MLFKHIWLYFTNTLHANTSTDKKILVLRLAEGILFSLAFLTALISIKIEASRLYFICSLLVTIFFLWFAIHLHKQCQFLKSLIDLQLNWGKNVKKNREFSFHTDFYKIQQKQENTFFIDDRTWLDLDMDSIYEEIDRTLTMPGEQYLYYLLRKPEFSNEVLKKRNHTIEYLKKNGKIRHSLQARLNRMGREGGEGIIPFIWDELPSAKPAWFYRGLYLLTLSAIMITVFRPTYWIFTVLPIFGVNMFVHFNAKRRIYRYLGSLFYLGRFLSGAQKIFKEKIEDPELEIYQNALRDALKPVKNLVTKTSIFAMKNNEIAEYFFILFLTEIRTFYKIIGSIRQHKEQLKQIYIILGELDAYLSIASYRAGLAYYCEPDLNSTHQGMQITELYHPLLKKPVSNSLHLQKKGALITGSNMSGKSTLLRAVGVNILLSQTIYTSLSKKYQGNFYKLLTSIGRSDNVVTGDSYYLVEAKALKRIIDELGVTHPILCIVDEIFRGTNSLERISASAEVLRYLAKHNCIIFAATHDLELTDMLKDLLHNFHFKETVNDQGLYFDYQLRLGPSTSRNAINLLEYLGYPTEVIAGARENIIKMEKKATAIAQITEN